MHAVALNLATYHLGAQLTLTNVALALTNVTYAISGILLTGYLTVCISNRDDVIEGVRAASFKLL